MVARRETVAYDQKMADGRTIEVKTCPTANGGWVGTFDDITERRRVEAEHVAATAEIHQQNILLDASLENMAHGLCVFDKDWRIIVRNRRYLELYGLGPDAAPPGTALVDLIRHSLDKGFYTTKASAEEFFADFQRQLAIWDVEVDHVALAHRGDRSADEGFWSDVARGESACRS